MQRVPRRKIQWTGNTPADSFIKAKCLRVYWESKKWNRSRERKASDFSFFFHSWIFCKRSTWQILYMCNIRAFQSYFLLLLGAARVSRASCTRLAPSRSHCVFHPCVINLEERRLVCDIGQSAALSDAIAQMKYYCKHTMVYWLFKCALGKKRHNLWS
jgi:hypothetical protein